MILVVALGCMTGLAVAAPVISRRLGRNTGYPLAVGFLAIGLLLAAEAPNVLSGRDVSASWAWLPSLDVSLSLRLDGLASLFSILVLGVGALIMAYCPRYLPEEGRHGTLYVLLTLFATAMLGLVLAADVVLLYVFWETTTILSFLLIGMVGPKATQPAVRALLITAGGGLALLGAVILVSVTTGTTDLGQILARREDVLNSPMAGPIGGLIVIAAFTKSAQVPFQFWLPNAMVAITPVSAYLHAATMVKAGIYLLLRFSTIYAGQFAWTVTLVGVGLVTAILGALLALRQYDLKALLAYSTVSQLGLLVAAIGVGTATALAAAILHTFAHAMFKAPLFMLVGIIDSEAGSRDIRELSGLRRVMPVTATLTGLAALSMAGVPPLLGFVSKESLFQGYFEADFARWAGPLTGALGVLAAVLTFAYGTRIFHGAFGGRTVQRGLYEPAAMFLVPAAIPVAISLLLGPGVALLNPLTSRSVLDILPAADPPYFELWHGLSPEVIMTGLTIAVGTTLFLVRSWVDATLQRVPSPRGGAWFDRTYDAVIGLGELVGRPDRTGSPASFLARPVIGLVALGGVGLVAVDKLPPPVTGSSQPLDWAILLPLAVAVAGAVVTRSALAAVGLLGIVGLLVAAWFLLAGGPDVALTLLLVEVLTAVVVMLVLRGLPPTFPRRPRGANGAIVLAVLAGAAAAVATWALTGRRPISPVGDYFLRSAEAETGGRNVVNTILVDFRGLDTLGEATVLGSVALGLLLLLAGPDRAPGSRAAAPPAPGLMFWATNRVLAPVMLVMSAYLFLRGHNEPGGGFIAALVAGVAVAFGYLAHGGTPGARRRLLRPHILMASGLLVAVGTGLVATIGGEPFLAPWKLSLPFLSGLGPSSALIFDLGIYLLVVGLVITAVDRLGTAVVVASTEQREIDKTLGGGS